MSGEAVREVSPGDVVGFVRVLTDSSEAESAKHPEKGGLGLDESIA